MAQCLYCEKPAGLLKKKHHPCEVKYKTGLQLIAAKLGQLMDEPDDSNKIVDLVSEMATEHFIGQSHLKKMAAKCWSNTLDGFLEDGLLDENEQQKLENFVDHFDLKEDILNQENKAFLRAQQALMLRSIMRGEIPSNIKLAGQCPVNLQKNEQIVWVFLDTPYLEDKIRRTYVGGSRGVSVRVAKGVYYRTGAFKGQTIERQERVHLDTGTTIVTNKNIYFAGSKKSLRVPYNKIVSFMPFDDGIGFVKDNQTAKPQILCTGSGWFAYNLITNLAQMAAK